MGRPFNMLIMLTNMLSMLILVLIIMLIILIILRCSAHPPGRPVLEPRGQKSSILGPRS